MPEDVLAPECDLVMKGGVTSGVVYVPLVLALKERFRFRSIGGTSAGAIVAAYTVAAELARERGGYERLKALGEQLWQPGFIQGLFQPSSASAPLFGLLTALPHDPKRSRLSRAFAALKPVLCGLGRWAALAFLLTFIALRAFFEALQAAPGSGTHWFLPGAAALLVALVAAGAVSIARLLRLAKRSLCDIAHNFFGFCIGRKDPDSSDARPVMIDWLHGWIQDLAGRGAADAPLTFADLATAGIQLRLTTTNLTQARAHVFPFEDEAFFFEESEFRRLFPDSVVNFLIAASARPGDDDLADFRRKVRLPAGFHHLPGKDVLPIVVAARMSMSFPLLLSMVPLHALKAEAMEKWRKGHESLTVKREDLVKNWFSDGGVCTNFPIHFFDAMLPGRPTFGINLAEMTEEASGDAFSLDQFVSIQPEAPSRGWRDHYLSPVYLPKPEDPPLVAFNELEPGGVPNLVRFAYQLVMTMKDHRDEMQAVLPSYRERIVNIRLAKEEGGLNLDMDPAVVDRLMAKGALAGKILLEHFKMEAHQWVRFRTLIPELQKKLVAMQQSLDGAGFYSKMLVDPSLMPSLPFRVTPEAAAEMNQRLVLLRTLLATWKDTLLDDSPEPRPVLRMTPRT